MRGGHSGETDWRDEVETTAHLCARRRSHQRCKHSPIHPGLRLILTPPSHPPFPPPAPALTRPALTPIAPSFPSNIPTATLAPLGLR